MPEHPESPAPFEPPPRSPDVPESTPDIAATAVAETEPTTEAQPEAERESETGTETAADDTATSPHPQADSGRAAWPLPSAVLGAVCALLLLGTATLGVGYLRGKDDLARQKKAVAARTAERDRLSEELATANTQRVQLEAKLKDTESKIIDPAGLELIKSCVRMGADTERLIQESPGSTVVFGQIPADKLPPGLLPPGGAVTAVVPPSGTAAPSDASTSPCSNGQPYLK